MNKRILSILIILILVATMVFTVGCNKDNSNCDHVIDEFTSDASTCTTDGIASGICVKCGKTASVVVKAHHRFDEDLYCTICGYEGWDGESIPKIEQIAEYTSKYLPKISANAYVDFASEIDIDLEEHPDLYDSGMFWCYYDEEFGLVREVSMRDHDKVNELIRSKKIDGAKPTIIFIHGIGVDTWQKYYAKDGTEIICAETYDAATNVLDPSDPIYAEYVEADSGKVNINLIYLKNGYNVINFSYKRFVDETAYTETVECSDGETRTFVYANNLTSEAKVYSTNGPAGMRYHYPNGGFSDGTIDKATGEVEVKQDVDFTMAEYFAAEYIRMYDYMIDAGVFNVNSIIQSAGHSMGGVVNVMGNFLLTELVRVGQIPDYYLPDRIILEDSYLGVYTDYGEDVPDFDDIEDDAKKVSLLTAKLIHLYGVDVHWTGEILDGCGSFGAYLCALYQISTVYDIPCEYYVDMSPLGFGGFSYASMPASSVRHLVWSLCAVQMYPLKYSCNSHNAIREYRAAAIIEGLNPKTADGSTALFSTLSDDEIRAKKGVIYYMVSGNNTNYLTDDVYEVRTIEQMLK